MFKKLFSNSQKTASDGKSFIDRFPRIKINPFHKVSFLKKDNHQEIGVHNLSFGGTSLNRKGFVGNLSVGQVITGDLLLNRDILPTSIQIRHINSQLIGCSFENQLQELKKHIERFFNYELAAMKLNAVSASLLKEDPLGKPLWFSDERGNELYLVVSNGKLIHFHLTFLGNYLEGQKDKKPLFGYVIDPEERSDKALTKGSLLIQKIETPDSSFSVFTERFLNGIEALPQDLKEQIKAQI